MPATLEGVLRGLRLRMPWNVASRLLDIHGMPRGRGWEKTIEKAGQRGRRDEFELDVLTEALTEHNIAGEKLTRFYRVNSTTMAELREFARSVRVSDSRYGEVYPEPLSDNLLQSSDTGPPILVGIEHLNGGTALVYSSIRVLTYREEIDPSEISAAAAESLQEYDEIIGLRNVRYQAVDTIWIPDRGRVIDIRVDYPLKMTQEQGLAYHLGLRNQFEADAGIQGATNPLNLFPAIDAIYQNGSEGNVVELAFGTTTASLKHERMRRSYMDLRQEIYHSAGKAALEYPIEPYRISLRWDDLAITGLSTSPELGLNGTSFMTGVENAAIYDATIRRCLGVAEYNFVRRKLLHYARSPAT